MDCNFCQWQEGHDPRCPFPCSFVVEDGEVRVDTTNPVYQDAIGFWTAGRRDGRFGKRVRPVGASSAYVLGYEIGEAERESFVNDGRSE